MPRFLNQIDDTVMKTTSTTTADQVLDTFPVATYTVAKYQMKVTSGTDIHFTEITLVYNSATVTTLMTEYGTIMSTSALAIFGADVSAGSVRLLVTPTNAATTYKYSRTVLQV